MVQFFWQMWTVAVSDSLERGHLWFLFLEQVGLWKQALLIWPMTLSTISDNAETASVFPPSSNTKSDLIDLFDNYFCQCLDCFPKSKIVMSDRLFHPWSTTSLIGWQSNVSWFIYRKTVRDPDHRLLRMCGSAVAALWWIWKSSTDLRLPSHVCFSSLISQRMRHQTKKKIHKPY